MPAEIATIIEKAFSWLEELNAMEFYALTAWNKFCLYFTTIVDTALELHEYACLTRAFLNHKEKVLEQFLAW